MAFCMLWRSEDCFLQRDLDGAAVLRSPIHAGGRMASGLRRGEVDALDGFLASIGLGEIRSLIINQINTKIERLQKHASATGRITVVQHHER